MKQRWLPYVTLILLSCLLALLPAALIFDLATPIDKWENWAWRGQPHPRPRFESLAEYPLLLRAEVWLFRALVAPPAFAAKIMGFWPGNYGLTYVSPGSSTEAFASLPPAALALEHLRRAIPFWLFLSVGLYEVIAVIRRRRRGRLVA